MPFNVGLLSNRCLANWSQYLLLQLRQIFVELWNGKEGLWFSCAVICTGENTHSHNSLFSPYFVILEFLQWAINTWHIFFLTWAPPFQYLVCLQKHTTQLLKLKVISVKKSIYILRFWFHGKGWPQEKEESNFNTQVGSSMIHIPAKLYHRVLPDSPKKNL